MSKVASVALPGIVVSPCSHGILFIACKNCEARREFQREAKRLSYLLAPVLEEMEVCQTMTLSAKEPIYLRHLFPMQI
jgi:hypothetical protein